MVVVPTESATEEEVKVEAAQAEVMMEAVRAEAWLAVAVPAAEAMAAEAARRTG